MAKKTSSRGAPAAPPGLSQNIADAPLPPPQPSDPLAAEIDALEHLSLDEIRCAWREKLKTAPPPLRARGVLLRLLTWNLQAERYGGLGPETQRRLKRLAREYASAPDRKLRTPIKLHVGSTLVREWKGVSHSVDVVDGGYVWNGKTHKTLSMIARAITKTNWSGPRFFGVEDVDPGDKKTRR